MADEELGEREEREGREDEEFTLDELARYDGRHGSRAYFAYKGKVYDATDSELWSDGDHLGEHVAGTDLTAEMALAPPWPGEPHERQARRPARRVSGRPQRAS